LIPLPISRYYDDDTGRYYTALTWSWNAGESLLDLTLRNIGRNFEYITSDEQGGTRNPFLDDIVQNQATKPGNVMQGYNAEAEEIFNAWTSGTVIGAGKTLEAYYTVTLNGNGKYVDFQGNTPADPNDVIERVIYVKSNGLADHTSTSGWTSPAGLQPTATSSAGPTIAECWQAINEYLTKFNGSQNNFTFLISYDEVFFEGLLDDYPGAEAAYSLRLLDKNYSGDAIRVRRASNNDEQDIGFDSYGDLDTAALAAFCSGTDCFVKVWYDQANGNDAEQTTTGNQPKIYDSSTGVVTNGGRPAIEFDGTSQRLTNANEIMTGSELCLIGVMQSDATTDLRMWVDQSGANYGGSLYQSNTDYYAVARFNATYVGLTTIGVTHTTYALFFANWVSGNSKAYINGIEEDSRTTSFSGSGNTGVPFWIGNDSADNTRAALGKLQEIIVYTSDQSTNRTGIETNINDYYDIY
jgi:hypothetical protein